MYQGTLLEFLNMGGSEIILILVVVLLLFGGKKLPELARGLGKGIREFKDASEGVKREIHRNINAMDVDKELEKEAIAKHNNQAYHPTETSPVDDEILNTHAADEKPAEVPYPRSTPITSEIVNDSHKV